MSRKLIVVVAALCLLSFAMIAAGPDSSVDPRVTRIAELEQQLADRDGRIAELESHLRALKKTRTATELLRLLFTEEMTWDLVVRSRHDYQNVVEFECEFPALGIPTVFEFTLNESPGDVTVGDQIKVSARLERIQRERRHTTQQLFLDGATIVERLRPNPAKDAIDKN
ncbi:MAG: hypothetical protein H6819_01405 [Phycisphaerales bacterium]|nr:hypothetical protein [Phycisphaerales bacterium]MCB9857135.1 hypothetical protein [Phycisphaerales bacterium]MCB9861738.1 hypothetical protein [Phycisphaerales bacterium]